MAAVEHPIDRIAGKDVRNFLLGWKKNQSRLQQAGPDHRRRVRLGHSDRARRARLKMFGLGGGMTGNSMRKERKSDADGDGDRWSHGSSFHC